MNEKNPGGWGVFAGLMLILVGVFNATGDEHDGFSSDEIAVFTKRFRPGHALDGSRMIFKLKQRKAISLLRGAQLQIFDQARNTRAATGFDRRELNRR